MSITQEQVKRLYSYDPSTGKFTRLVTTNPRAKAGTKAGTKTGDGYLKVQIDREIYRLHTLAWLYVTGSMPPEGMFIDHINQQRDDNRFVNLRLADHELNAQNIRQPQHRDGRTSKHRGVHFDASRGLWFAQIAINGKKRFLGRFKTEVDALSAYERARADAHPYCPANSNAPALKVPA